MNLNNIKIAVGADHAGYSLKEEITQELKRMGFQVVDVGVHSPERADYPDQAHLVAKAVAEGEVERGILVCGTGIGMSMAANRHRGVRAALCHDAYTAEMARRHNDANVLCLGGRVTGTDVALQAVRIFLSTPFEGGRHKRRIEKIEVGGLYES